MVVFSCLRGTVLPVELERKVFLLASSKPHELVNYMNVARRVKAWIEPILYRELSISSEAHARSLLQSLTMRSKTILYLRAGVSVSPGTVALLLRRCPRLISLTIHGGGNRPCRFHVILCAVNNLTYLRHLSVDPSIFFQNLFVHLPDSSAFHRVTHLDLTAHGASDIVTSGYQHLCHLTHLSMTWNMGRMATHGFLELLRRQNFKLILLWLGGIGDLPRAVRNLRKRKLDDPRMVLLPRKSDWSMEQSGCFWPHAERVITWRKKYGVTTVERPTMSEIVASFSIHTPADYQSLSWERD